MTKTVLICRTGRPGRASKNLAQVGLSEWGFANQPNALNSFPRRTNSVTQEAGPEDSTSRQVGWRGNGALSRELRHFLSAAPCC